MSHYTGGVCFVAGGAREKCSAPSTNVPGAETYFYRLVRAESDLLDAVRGARGCDSWGADVSSGRVTSGDNGLNRLCRDRDRRNCDERLAVQRVRLRRVLALQELDRERRSSVGLEVEGLVNRSVLLSEENVLQTSGRSVLTRGRNLQAVLVQ